MSIFEVGSDDEFSQNLFKMGSTSTKSVLSSSKSGVILSMLSDVKGLANEVSKIFLADPTYIGLPFRLYISLSYSLYLFSWALSLSAKVSADCL